MSCVSQQSQPFRFVVSMGALPENFCGTQQQLAQAIADRLIIQSDQNFSSFAIGPTAPTSNVGPWLKDCSEWYVWDDSVGAYVPMKFPSIASILTGMIMAWSGAIATIPAGYLFCNGAEYLAQNYPDLYAVIGTSYGVGGCAGSFKVPDLRNKFIVGADADTANVATSTVSDGATALKERGFTAHVHSYTVPFLAQDGTNPGGGPGTFNTGVDSPRAIPPFMAHPWIIKT